MSVLVERKEAPRLLVTALALVAALLVVLGARTSSAAEAPTVSVLTMGPGDPTFSKFGHDAIVVSSASSAGAPSLVFNFGTFSFQSNQLFQDFLKGRLRYWLSLASLEGTVRSYKRQNRSLLLQELDLDPSVADALAAALEENAKPENRFYLYDHFRDNCATRVRDAIDRATGGSVRRALERPATSTYRDHALRLVADDWPLYIGLDFGLGPAVDGPITEWDEGFLPERLALGLRKVRIRSAKGDVPLVRREIVVFEADRPAARERPPVRAPWFLAVGVLLGGSLAALFRRSSRAARIVAGALLAALGTLSGLLGALLVFLWAATNTDVAHRNANAFLSPVVALALVPAGILFAMGRSSGKRLVERSLFACAVLAGMGVVLALVVGHDVFRTASLFVPLWVGAWAGLRFGLNRA
ncbi:MAG TPA: DUF4105 domain-containing protein [Polyangiaceae bacterium]|nr:DUF4105 domain-containing protein [Polyangiaceae bacterium]